MLPQAYVLLEEIAHYGGLAVRARRFTGPARTTPTAAPASSGRKELLARQQSFEDADAVLDLVWFEVREGLGQFRNGDDRVTAIDSQGPGSTHGAAVQVDPRWKEIALHADAERGVIDRKDADAVDPISDPPRTRWSSSKDGASRRSRSLLERHLANSRRTLQGIRHWCGCFPPSPGAARAAALITLRRVGIAR